MKSAEVDNYVQAQRMLALAAFAQKHLPRGKGAVPRWLGKVGRGRPQFLVTKHDIRLVMAPTAWDVYATITANDGIWDEEDLQWCINSIPDSGVFYDIGANVGLFSLEVAKVFREPVQVVSFEPNASLARSISESARINGMQNIHVLNAMAGNIVGMADFFLAPASIHSSAVPDSGRPVSEAVPVQMFTIDSLVRDRVIPPPDMIKMDVEGSEHLVLEGARDTLRTYYPHMLIEYIARHDPQWRVRQEVESLVNECDGLELFGHAANGKLSGRPYMWFRIRDEDDWLLCDNVFLRSTMRPLRDSAPFEPL